jgi:hypothetical protein
VLKRVGCSETRDEEIRNGSLGRSTTLANLGTGKQGKRAGKPSTKRSNRGNCDCNTASLLHPALPQSNNHHCSPINPITRVRKRPAPQNVKIQLGLSSKANRCSNDHILCRLNDLVLTSSLFEAVVFNVNHPNFLILTLLPLAYCHSAPLLALLNR